ncbi:hypothetical protein OSTOST_20574 [Ostertagia ostertagi]
MSIFLLPESISLFSSVVVPACLLFYVRYVAQLMSLFTTSRNQTSRSSFDLILTSETIYNPEDYEALHDAFDYALSSSGVIWVAAKVFYFGVGGDIPTFTDFVEKKGVFKIETKQSISADIPRVILG